MPSTRSRWPAAAKKGQQAARTGALQRLSGQNSVCRRVRRAALCRGCLAPIPCVRSRGARLREFAGITFAMVGGRTVAACGSGWAGSDKGGGRGRGRVGGAGEAGVASGGGVAGGGGGEEAWSTRPGSTGRRERIPRPETPEVRDLLGQARCRRRQPKSRPRQPWDLLRQPSSRPRQPWDLLRLPRRQGPRDQRPSRADCTARDDLAR